jgi:hypothetical protein
VVYRRLETREWIRLHPGVFKLGSSAATVDELEMAALLAAGDGAVLSHRSAAARLGLEIPRDEAVQVTIPGSRGPLKLSGVRVWRSRALLPSEIAVRGPFRVTHLARTMIDLASVVDDKWLRAALDSALRKRRSNLTWIFRLLNQRGQGRRGADRLRALIAEYRDGDELPDSVLESFALQLAQATGHNPELHSKVFDGERRIAEVDLAWPEVRVCADLDGWTWHSSREAFVEDRVRDRALQRLGWMVLRYTWHEVSSDPESWVAQMVEIYKSRAAALSRRRRRAEGDSRETFRSGRRRRSGSESLPCPGGDGLPTTAYEDHAATTAGTGDRGLSPLRTETPW